MDYGPIEDGQEIKEKSIIEIIIYYLTVLLRYKVLIIIITSLIGAGTFSFLFIAAKLPPEKSPLPDIYRAQIVLYIQSEGNSGLESFFSSSFQDSPLSSVFSGIDTGDLAIAVIHSGIFLDLLAEELKLSERYELENPRKTDYRKLILSKLQTIYDRTRSLLIIRCEDIDPEFTAELANLTAKHLMKWFTEKGGTKKTNLKNLIEEKLVTVTEEIAKIELEIQKFQKKYGILTPEELANIHTELLTDLNNQLMLKELEIKNYSELIKVEDSRIRRLKIERDNILEFIDRIENGYTSSGRALPPKSQIPDLLLKFNQLHMNLELQNTIFILFYLELPGLLEFYLN
jgi:hypothetical protein